MSATKSPGMGHQNDAVVSSAFKEGAKAFVVVGVCSTLGVLGALRFSPGFRRNLGTSGRVATAFMPPLFAYTYVAESHTTNAANPDLYAKKERQVMLQNMPIHHRIANYIHHKPFQVIAYVGVPTVFGLFMLNGQSHLSLSQRVMNTRVMGQASVIAILCSTMAFYDYMEKHGDFSN